MIENSTSRNGLLRNFAARSHAKRPSPFVAGFGGVWGSVKLNAERVQYWISQGAQPTDRVARFLEAAGLKEKTVRNNPKAAKPGKAMAERAAKKAARAAAPAEE